MKIEFFLDKTGTLPRVIYLKWDDNDWTRFEDLTPIQIEMIFDKVAKFTKIRKAIMHLSKYPGFSSKNDILKQIILCNWTKLDNKLDISDSKVIFENVSCPFKSNDKCPYQGKGIVCQKF